MDLGRMTATMSKESRRCLEYAEWCIHQAEADADGPWLRAAPFLLRRSLESAVVAMTSDRAEGASMRARFLCLGVLADPDLSARTTWLWARLSEACHYPAYRLDPTLDDVRRAFD